MAAEIVFLGEPMVPALESTPATVSTKIAAVAMPSIPSQLESMKDRSGSSAGPQATPSTS